jgi:hypothetical protein
LQTAAKSAEITLEGILREPDEAIAIAKHKNQPNATAHHCRHNESAGLAV